MNNKDLQRKYNELVDRSNRLKLENAKLEANIESSTKERDATIAEINKLAGTTNLDDAQKKFGLLKAKAEEIINEAETLLESEH